MTFGFTRDSLLLYLAGIGTVLGYLAAAEHAPTEWTYKEWVQFGLMFIAWITGKLQSSPLPHSEFGTAKITAEDIRRENP